MSRGTSASQNRCSVVLSNSGGPYAYHMAFALQEAGFLKAFLTTAYQFRNGRGVPFLSYYLKGRRHDGLREELIDANPWPESVQRAFRFLAGDNRFAKNDMLHWRNRWFARSVARKLEKTDFDCFIGSSGSSLDSIRLAKARGRWTIVDQHDVHPDFAERLLREEIELHPDFAPLISYWPPHRDYLRCVKEELEKADRIMVYSRFALESHVQNGIQNEKLISLPLGSDLPQLTSSSGRERRPFRVLFVGAISQRKGIKYLLEAVKRLHLRDLELVLAGRIDGSSQPLEPYQNYFKHAGFLSKEKLEAYWKTAHVLVLPSLYDNFGLVVLEAMAHGVPVIVSEHTGACEVVREGIDGFIIPIRNVEALQDRILRLYEHHELVHTMGENARQRAQDFTWLKYQERLAVFLSTLEEASSESWVLLPLI